MLYLCKINLLDISMKLKIKYLLLGLMLSVAIQSLNAEPVDTVTVKMVARNFFRNISAKTSRSLAEPCIVYKESVAHEVRESRLSRDYFYIVNLGDEGFVMVAADDRSTPILAYSATSSFDVQRMPSNMVVLLRDYQEQMDEIDRQQIEATSSVRTQWENLRHQRGIHTRNVVVEPLITSKWAQEPYYNALCPADPRATSGHASAGCVAVAMGQIIRYWSHPEHGEGIHSYEANNSIYGRDYGDYGTLTADFSNTYYDYDNMPDSLTASSSAQEVNAVATLLYHCGVSVDMMYGVGNSSAFIASTDDALSTYFSFSTARHVYRSVYVESDWLNMMREELNYMRPVFYSGVGSASVHAFVCDGYDDQGYFHFNWGWGGNADGYFLLSNLNPAMMEYNSIQTAIVGVEVDPPLMTVINKDMSFFMEEGDSAEIQQFTVYTVNIEDPIHVSVTGEFSVSTDAVNFSSQLNLPSPGGIVYVKYNPAMTHAHYELNKVVLNAGVCTDSVNLVGVAYLPECHAPLNFNGVQGDIDTDTNQVMLTWDSPIPDVVNASWDSIPETLMGSNDPYIIEPVHRLSLPDLLPLHHHRLTHLSFIPESQVSEYRLRIYVGGSVGTQNHALDPGTLIHDQAVNLSSLTMGEWNTIALDSAIVIDASRELWYGLYISAPAHTSTISTGETECVWYKGNIYAFYYAGNVSWYPYNRNFVMKAVIENPFVRYELYRDGDSLVVPISGTSYADYPPVYAHYLYEVKAVWNDQCAQGATKMVNFRAPCHVVNLADYVTACDSFVWKNDTTYYESGDYLYEYYNEDECWQVDTLHLIVNQSTYYTEVLEVCDSLRWIDGETYFESISGPVKVLTNAVGCDSVVTLNLTVNHSCTAVDSVFACDSYVWIDGHTYTESTDTAVFTLTNHAGCDSVVTLHLTLGHSSPITIDSVVECDSYEWIDGQIYTESTQLPTVTYTNVEGCDSVVNLHLTILNSSFVVDSVVSCSPYTWIDGHTYEASTNLPTMTYTNAVGCDSVVNLHLIMLQATSYVDSVVACDSYTWLDGITYTESIEGPVITFTDVIGCDNATVTLHLTIQHSSGSDVYEEACDTYTWIDGVTYTESTDEATMVYTNAVGCDSVVTLHLTVNYSSSAIDSIFSPTPYTWLDGRTYSESIEGPTVVLTNEVGCDSIVVLHLEITDAVENYNLWHQVVVYPNPSRGLVHLKLPQELKEITLEAKLFDMFGKLLIDKYLDFDNPVLDLSGYAQGMYLIQLYHQHQLIGTAKISKTAN